MGTIFIKLRSFSACLRLSQPRQHDLTCRELASPPSGLEFLSMDDEIARQFAIRDNFRRKLADRETYSERTRKMALLQEATWKALQTSPTGWAHFLRRNFKARAIDVGNLQAPDLQLLEIVHRHWRACRECARLPPSHRRHRCHLAPIA